MAGQLIAVQGMTFLQNPPTALGSFTLVDLPSTKVKAGGSFAYLDGLQLIASAVTNPPATIPDPVSYTFTFEATAEKVNDQGTLVLRLNDETDSQTITPQVPGSPPTNSPFSLSFQIIDAGQTKALAS